MDKIEITPEFLAELKEKAEKATPGPYKLEEMIALTIFDKTGDSEKYYNVYTEDNNQIAEFDDVINKEANAAYIAASNPQVVLALIEKLERLEKKADWLANYIGEHECVKGEPETTICPHPTACTNCWREAAKKAVDNQVKPDLFNFLAAHPDAKLAPEEE